MPELGRLVAEHGLRASDLHPLLLQPADEPEELTVAFKGVAAQVTEERRAAEEAGSATRWWT